jgi:putative protease
MEIVEEEHGTYLLNSKDLCLIKYLEKMAAVGISSFKIEGRAKSVYYQAVVVNAYRQAINKLKVKNEKLKIKEINKLFEELNTRLVHRGYTTGFLLGGKGEQNLENSHVKCDWEFCGVATPPLQGGAGGGFKIKVHNTLKTGDEIEIVRPFLPILKIKLQKMLDANTGEEITEVHGGGGGSTVIIESQEEIPEFSVLRRKIK